MVTIRIKLKSGTLKDLAGSISQAIMENMYDLHYLDYYNSQHMIKRLIDKNHALNTFDPFRPQKSISLKININEAESYRTIMLMKSIIWENEYLSELHRDLISQIDPQLDNVKKII